jgi:hypothetical protein
MNRVFLLSPAHTGGLRAATLLRPEADFDLARRIRRGAATLGEVFTFCSGLYFRGKMAYARRFASPPRDVAGAMVITAGRGLLAADTLITPEDLAGFARVPVEAGELRFTAPLEDSVRVLARRNCEVVLLGSIATGKYVDVLLPILGNRLLFPGDFVGRGDMSRGGLMLRAAASGEELAYVPVDGAARRGTRPPKLPPSRRITAD